MENFIFCAADLLIWHVTFFSPKATPEAQKGEENLQKMLESPNVKLNLGSFTFCRKVFIWNIIKIIAWSGNGIED